MVLSARVHLALPDKEVFVRQQAEPTASVFLQLSRGRSLGRSKVDAITPVSYTHLTLPTILLV